jgi:hypothetical protein
MIAWCIVDSPTITQGDLDLAIWTFCKKVSDRSNVATAGTLIYNYGGGHYILDNPNADEDTLFQVPVAGNIFEGAFSKDLWSILVPGEYPDGTAGFELGRMGSSMDAFIIAIGRLLSQTYNVGQISSPYAPLPGGTLPIFVQRNYTGTTVVGEKWALILQQATAKVFFVAKVSPNATTNPVIDAECTIDDPVTGTITIELSKTQTNVKPGDYFWQLEARTYDGALLDELWVMQEGRLYVKPTFKAL